MIRLTKETIPLLHRRMAGANGYERNLPDAVVCGVRRAGGKLEDKAFDARVWGAAERMVV